MSDTVIRVENLCKKYIIGHQKQERYTALRDVVADGAKSFGRQVLKPFGKRIPDLAVEEFWALKDVSFEIKRGDRVGIIGRNGAGKSTLLKILSRITEPTTGRISLKGRVASLLEVGTGFHPELTGRENIYLNGAVLGMGKAEIKKKFDEIVAFAEVEKFLDTPVKRYSSGMYVRLAFAVAAHLEPEILVVDEVLAVGDVAFQKKCLGKMEDVAENEGRTVLFVSHNIGAITRLCQRGLWLDRGQLYMKGDTEQIISHYLTTGATLSGEYVWDKGIANPGVDEFKIWAVRIKNDKGEVTGVLDAKGELWIEIEYEMLKRLPFCRIGIIITTLDGVIVLDSYDAEKEEYASSRELGFSVNKCKIPGNLLNLGRFTLSINAGIRGVKNLVMLENVLVFEIENTSFTPSYINGMRKGIIAPNIKWQKEEISTK